MSLFSEFVESLSSIFSNFSPDKNPSSSSSPTANQGMDGVANERIAYKLKGYFDLATGQIDKAVRAEEWGLNDDAILHYQNAQRILAEAISTPVPIYITPSEQEKVNSYRQKISKWQSQVSDRLRTLGRRSGGPPINKNTSSQVRTASVSPSTSNSRKVALTNSSGPSVHNPLTWTPNKVMNSKPVQGSGTGQDSKLVEMINSIVVDRSPSVKWDDIAGLEKAKQALLEMVILPTKRKDLFTGLRRPAKGLLLFGPPGTGKTMLAKAVASESEATFFNVSASSLTSKWVGEGEKLVRTLFTVAISRQPSVIFMDEIDSIMSARTSDEHDASRRLKSEFLVQFDGVTSNSQDLVIVIVWEKESCEGIYKNSAYIQQLIKRPQEEAVLRALDVYIYSSLCIKVKRIYIPLPDANVRRLLLKHRLKGQAFSLPSGDLERLVGETEGYSGSDLHALCEEAAMMPIRELGSDVLTIKANQVRRLRYGDFQKAMSVIRPSLQKSKWEELEKWNRDFGAN